MTASNLRVSGGNKKGQTKTVPKIMRRVASPPPPAKEGPAHIII